MRIQLLIVLSIITFHIASGQSVKDEFEKIGKLYSNNNFSYSVTYSYYNDYQSATADEIQSGFMKTKGDNYHYKVGDYEVFRNSKYTIALDRSRKSLMLDTVVQQDVPAEQPEDISAMLKAYDKIERIESAQGITYKVTDPRVGVAYMLIIADKDIKYIKSLELFFYENRPNKPSNIVRNRLVISFSQVNLEVNLSNEYFSSKKYISRTKQGYIPNSIYKSYEFISNI